MTPAQTAPPTVRFGPFCLFGVVRAFDFFPLLWFFVFEKLTHLLIDDGPHGVGSDCVALLDSEIAIRQDCACSM